MSLGLATEARQLEAIDVGNKWALDDRGQLDKKINQQLDQNLQPGEVVRVIIPRASALGRDVAGEAIVGTDRRVFVFKRPYGGHFTNQLSSWEYSKLTGIEIQQWVFSGYVALVGPGLPSPMANGEPSVKVLAGLAHALVVAGSRGGSAEWLPQRVAVLRSLVAAPPTSPSAGPDPLDQLRKLGELRDAGIVSAAEFDAKKAELLSRM